MEGEGADREVLKRKASEGGDHEILKLKEAKALMDRRREEWALKDRTAAEEAQPAGAAEEAQPTGAGKKKRKKVVKSMVPQGLIDYMILNPHKPFRGFREETLAKRSQRFREYYAREKAIADKFLEYELALIMQFVTKGYAEDEMEVTDDDDEDI